MSTLKCPVCKMKTVSLVHYNQVFRNSGQGSKRYQYGTLKCSRCNYEEVLGGVF